MSVPNRGEDWGCETGLYNTHWHTQDGGPHSGKANNLLAIGTLDSTLPGFNVSMTGPDGDAEKLGRFHDFAQATT